MTNFNATTHAEAIVLAPPAKIWAVLTDPALVAQLTPFLKRITADGDRWRWHMTGLEVVGKTFAPEFTERMVFNEPTRIEFHHDPPEESERSGVEGWYELTEVEGGTKLVTDLSICLDLPLPKAANPAVTSAMSKVIDQIGDVFADNLLDHIGATQR